MLTENEKIAEVQTQHSSFLDVWSQATHDDIENNIKQQIS